MSEQPPSLPRYVWAYVLIFAGAVGLALVLVALTRLAR